MIETRRIAIIGAGIGGLTAAYYLSVAAAGRNETVDDPLPTGFVEDD